MTTFDFNYDFDFGFIEVDQAPFGGESRNPLDHPLDQSLPMTIPLPMTPGPIKGFERGRAFVHFNGEQKEIVILSKKKPHYDRLLREYTDYSDKIFKAYIEVDGQVKKLGCIKLFRFPMRKGEATGVSRVPQIFVSTLVSQQNDKYKGVGTALMQTAMEYGYSKGCGGRMTLLAGGSSHVFYYKLGMRTYSEGTDRAIAALAAQQRKQNSSWISDLPMYMPEQGIAEWKRRIQAKPIFETRTPVTKT